MIIKGNNEFKKSTSEPVKQDDKSNESSKLVKVEILKANDKELKIVNGIVDPRKNSHIKFAMSYVAITLLAIFLTIVIIIAVLHSPYSIFSTEESRIYMNDIVNDFENWRYKMIKDSDDIIEEREYVYVSIIMQDNETLTINNEPEDQLQCKKVPISLRFDCLPEFGGTESNCTKRGCCWNPVKYDSEFLNVPYCYYPYNWSVYKYENYSQQDNSFSGFLTLKEKSAYKKDIPLVKMETTIIDSSIIRVKIYDPANQRYEPPWPIKSDFQSSYYLSSKPQYRFITDDEKIGFRIDRVADNTTLFDSIGIGGFIFADQFLQISAILPSQNIYGIGEHRTHLKVKNDWKRYTMFNMDQPPIENANLYGSHPFYLMIEESGNCHGVLFLNSNPMETILQPTPSITFRSIGGIFDMYFFLGPTPQDVAREYSQIVGKPFLPPYWSLGFHLCRFGYGSLEKTKEVWNRTIQAGIPFDTQWNDLDYMDKNNDFTYNNKTFKDLPRFVEQLHNLGMHYIPLIDAGIGVSEKSGSYRAYDEGVKEEIFVKDAVSNQPFEGKVWNKGSTVWPDFTNPKTKDYYLNMMQDLHNNFQYDGAWIDMNEPSNFYNGNKNGCIYNELDYPEYTPMLIGKNLAVKTLCMNAKHYLGPHYNLHNTYGISHAIATNYALTNIRKKRPFIISRSTWVGHGMYAGHWSGDDFSTWYDLRMSIPEILHFNLFQIPMVGADICGFNGNTTAALCNRWMQLGAFYPFARNHNSDSTIEQDPVALGDLVVKSSKRAFTIRYWLLPYLYTLFFRAHRYGETVARPLFFEFINDKATYEIDSQFMWGGCLMINPVLEEGKTYVTAYIPHGLWYDLYTKKSFFSIGQKITFNAPLDTIPLLIRGGSILPAQKPGATTTESRKNSFELLVALDQYNFAQGELYWDDGDSLDSLEKKEYIRLAFVAYKQTLSSAFIEKGTFKEKMILNRIQILGVRNSISQVLLNNNDIPFKYDSSKWSFSITGLLWDMKESFNLTWKY
ncbi:lysosomal alpha-glucosidase-like [Vespa crabro]|uniref:lysosomal alpha-glucosidase-like n=1 Tax=Vespa crabro TaxID=7445 RepID=UPI001F01723C|nr:lysosomal alpha-glucosidase-like [Vespa crabro]